MENYDEIKKINDLIDEKIKTLEDTFLEIQNLVFEQKEKYGVYSPQAVILMTCKFDPQTHYSDERLSLKSQLNIEEVKELIKCIKPDISCSGIGRILGNIIYMANMINHLESSQPDLFRVSSIIKNQILENFIEKVLAR